MGIFNRRGRDADRDVNADIERAKREGSELIRVDYVHNNIEPLWPSTQNRADRRSPRSSSPSCKSASTPQRGRRW